MAGSWFSQVIHSLFNGGIGAAPVTHSDGVSNPVHAVVDNFNSAAAALGQTTTQVAETEIGSIVTKYAGPEAGLLGQMMLAAIISVAQDKLNKATGQPAATQPQPQS